MLDANGNWYPNLPDGPPIFTACGRDWCVSEGIPSANQGNDGDLVISRSSGTPYEKVDGVWVPFPGYTGSSGSNNLYGTSSPVGSVTPDYVGQFFLDGPSPFDIYVSTGPTSANWLLVAGGITP